MQTHRWVVLVCHRRSGKTLLAIIALIHRALNAKVRSARYMFISNELKQSRRNAWHYLKHYAGLIPGTKISESDLSITLPNGAEVKLYGAQEPDSLRGGYIDGAVLDEVGQISEDVWDSILRPQLADHQGWALFLGTPKGTNWLSRLWFGSESKQDWARHRFTIYETKALPDSEVAALLRDTPPEKFRREFLCDFDAAAGDILLSLSEVEAAMKRSYQRGDFEHAAKVLGVDVARQGDDSSVIVRRQGLMVWQFEEMQIPNAMTVADRVARHINEWSPDAVLVDGTGGYGAGVIDRLKQLGHRVIEVQFGGQANDVAQYLNKRAEMWYLMAQAIKSNLQLPRVSRLIDDLTAPTYEHNNKGQIVLESKDDMKSRGLASPDFGDALACTFAAEVRPEGLSRQLDDLAYPPQRFDPLARVRPINTTPQHGLRR